MRSRNRLLADIHQEMVLSRESRDDMREFIRETTIRIERTFNELSTVIQDQSAAVRKLASEVREGRDERRAQTEALMHILDRMNRLDPGGAAS